MYVLINYNLTFALLDISYLFNVIRSPFADILEKREWRVVRIGDVDTSGRRQLAENFLRLHGKELSRERQGSA
jgi:hypothetical protein